MITATREMQKAARYVRARHLDRRIACGDGHCADAWIDRETRGATFVAPGHDPNGGAGEGSQRP